MISKMEPKGSRIAIISNGSPLFTGDAGSGESNIRKWIIENDWLEAIVALPTELFYTQVSPDRWCRYGCGVQIGRRRDERGD